MEFNDDIIILIQFKSLLFIKYQLLIYLVIFLMNFMIYQTIV